MYLTKNKFFKKTICLGLSAALIYNTTVPAFGQEFFYTDNPAAVTDNTYFDHTMADMKADIINSAKKEYDKKMKDGAYARAEEIKKEIMGNSQEELYKEYFEPKTTRQGNIDYKTEYLQGIKEQADNAKGEVQAQYENMLQELDKEEANYLASNSFTRDEIANWKAENLANINTAYNDAISKINTHFKSETDKVNNNFEEFIQELKVGAEEAFYDHIKTLFDELMTLYEQEPNKVKEQVLELTPVITALVDQEGKHIYDTRQQQMLLTLYRKVIEEENAKVGKDNNFFTNACEINGHCPELLSAIMGISVLTDKQSDTDIILDTIDKYKGTAANFEVLLHGISGLLVMEEYNSVRNILRKHTEEEHEFHLWDEANFTSIMNHISFTNGRYLGNLSKAGEYWIGDKYQNIYSDIAQMLAEEGSEGSLNILREFGVDKCFVYRNSGVKKETLAKYSISCGGIKPFLVGALLSGKSGSNSYRLQRPYINATQYFSADGRVHNYSEQFSNTEVFDVFKNNYDDLAREAFNGDAEAMIALHVMSEGMGDLNPDQEKSLDTVLYEEFKERIPERLLKSKHIIIDNDRYSKKENRNITRSIFLGVGFVADVLLTVFLLRDIAVLGTKAISLGRGIFSAFKAAKIGLTIKNIPALAKVATNYTRTGFMRQKMVVKVTNFGNKLRKVSTEYKSAIRLNVLSNAAEYTNVIYGQVKGSLVALDAVPNLPKGLAGMVKGLRYDQSLGAFILLDGAGEALNISNATTGLTGMMKGIKFDKDIGTFVLLNNAETPTLVASVVDDIVATATTNAKTKYRVAKLFKKGANFKEIFLEELGNLVAASPLSLEDQKLLSEFFKSADFKTVLADANNHITSLGSLKHTGRDFAKDPLVLPGFLGEGTKQGQRIGVDFTIRDKMPAFANSVPKYATIAEDEGRVILKFFKDKSEALDLSAFKLGFESTESFADFARSSAELGDLGKIELKFVPKEANTFWTRNVTNVFARSKDKLFAGRGTVSLFKEGKQIETGITLRTYKKYDGLKVFINEDLGGAVSVFRGNSQLPVTTEGAFFLPKRQMRNFLNFTKVKSPEAPWKINLIGGKNKVNALYFQSMVSLSVASTGLVGPLSKNYPDMEMKELTFISLIFPYLLSAATPFVSPFVKKFGAINVLKTSMYLSLASLAMPIVSGFHGFGGIQADNPFSKPSPSLLYPSALLIGLSTTLTRGSYSPLIQAIGGGSGTLKAVAFKSISSFMLVLPPVIGAAFDKISPKYFKNADGTLYLNKEGNPVQKHWFDFSFSYPVMLGIAGAALYKVQKVHFNRKIGRSPNSFTNAREFFRDVGSSYGLLAKKDLLPLTVSSALLAGAESSLLYTYSNSMANEYVRNSLHTEELVPVVALVGLNAPAFITRLNSKSLLKAFGGDNLTGYRNMLTVSLASAGIGSYLLATQDSPLSFAAGLTLTSIGFSQITSSILRYGHNKLAMELKAPKSMITSWDVSYPTVYIGMSAVPYLYGNMNDKNIAGLQTQDKADMVSLKNTSWQEMLGIPIATLIMGGGLSYLGMRPKTALRKVNTGILAPLGLIAESHNPGFTTLILPKPVFNQQQPQLKPFEPSLQYNPITVPSLKVNPDFSIQPVR